MEQQLTQQSIKQFNSFGIKPIIKAFIGDKIKVDKILDKEIIVHDFKVVPSKYNGECLYLQITFKEEKRVVFTSGTALIETLNQIPKSDFPFKTTVIKENEMFWFS